MHHVVFCAFFSSLHSSWKEVEGEVFMEERWEGVFFSSKISKTNFSQKIMGDTTRFIF